MSELIDVDVDSDGRRLVGRLALPAPTASQSARIGVVICHGLPQENPQNNQGITYDHLSARIAGELGFVAAAVNLSGIGGSEGYFSVGGWSDDVVATAEHLAAHHDVNQCLLIGVATGGSIAMCAAAREPRIEGVATLAARADFDDWAAHPRRFLEHCRRIGVIKDQHSPEDFDAWAAQLRVNQPLDAARRLGNRALFLIHGGADRLVPLTDAQRLAEAHGAAELRIVAAAGHSLRHDPRVIALLLGWLDRQRTEAPTH